MSDLEKRVEKLEADAAINQTITRFIGEYYLELGN